MRKKKRRSFGSYLLQDLLLALLFLCVFAVFHHVLPRWRPQTAQIVAPVAIATAAPQETPAPTAIPDAGTALPGETEAPSTPTPTPRPLTLAEKFADYFTEDVRQGDGSYSSPFVSVTVERRDETINGIPQRCYIADIHIADIHCLRTAPAENGFTVYSAASGVSLDKKNGAVVAINGDYCNVSRDGLLVRNGDLYFSDPTVCDICVLYEDGVMETYAGGSYDVDEILARSPYQIWRFGPQLLDENGAALTAFENTAVMTSRHPRTGLGYYEPGHYCFVVFEGRFNDAGGLSMEEFAAWFERLGCMRAYNMDGGASSVMTFDDRLCNRQSSDRLLGDIIYICEPDTPWPELVS